MKGIILAGGSGTRLYPIDHQRQQTAPAGLRQTDDLLSALHADAGGHPGDPDHLHARGRCRCSARCCGDGSQWGLRLAYVEQTSPRAGRRLHRRPGVRRRPARVPDPGRQHLLRPGAAGQAAGRRPGERRRAGVRLSGQGSPTLWRGRVRRDRPRPEHRGEAADSRSRTTPCPASTSTTRR